MDSDHIHITSILNNLKLCLYSSPPGKHGLLAKIEGILGLLLGSLPNVHNHKALA